MEKKYQIGILSLSIFVFMFLQVDAMTCTLDNDTFICDGEVNIANDSQVICMNLNDSVSGDFFVTEMISYRDLWKDCILNDESVPEDYIPTTTEIKGTELYNTLESDFQSLQSEYTNYKGNAVSQLTYSSCTNSLDNCTKAQDSSWQKYLIGFGACFLLLYAANKSPKELLGRGAEPKHDIEEEFGSGQW